MRPCRPVNPGMLHHTFDQDPDDPQAFVWSEVYANDAAFSAHVSNPPVQEYLQKHAELGDGFSVEVYGTVGAECRALMESFGLPLKIHESRWATAASEQRSLEKASAIAAHT